jgi:exosortase E/protease (VPEID-CTERM system)
MHPVAQSKRLLALHREPLAQMSFAARVSLFALILFVERFLLSFLVEFNDQITTRLGEAVHAAQHFAVYFAVTLGVSLAVFSYVSGNQRWSRINSQARGTALRPRWLLLHGALLLALIPLLYSLYGHGGTLLPFAEQAALSVLLSAAAVLALSAAMAPWSFWREAAKALGVLWLYASLAATAAVLAIQWRGALWTWTAGLTFELVQDVLGAIIPNLRSDPANLILSTDRFAVQVSDYCSGLEGVGLMLAFTCAWLMYFRREYIFPRALILIPAGVALIFILNALRIAALVLIGHYGFPTVAAYGFHSQAGWIAFNAAAGGLAFTSRSSSWLSRPAFDGLTSGTNPTAAYLLPFLAILAAGMVARALSDGFEMLYPLRLAAAAAALAAYRGKLSGLDWRFSWRGPIAGIAVFALWIVAAHFLVPASPIPSALANASPLLLTLWITARVTAGVITVPLAEELAYRGYLLRRISAADFESVPFKAVSLWPLMLSSAVFGLSHGSMWLPGIAAGLMYGGLLVRTGRIGEAVSAHATTNAFVAATVLLGDQWQLW